MLEYSKKIIANFSFDHHLFNKEIQKTFSYLDENEKKDFEEWCIKTFDLTEESLKNKLKTC